MDDAALYLEVDEDITSAIDKLGKTAGKSVSIVVPKRSTMLQSVINLKLLKKAAAEQGKELVLVTGDKVATDLAARVGLAVAPSLGAKAVMGEAAALAPAAVEDVIEEDDPPPPLPEEPKAPPAAAAGSVFKRRDIDDKAADPADGPIATPDDAGPASRAKGAPKVPNFSKMTRRLVWVGGAVALLVAYFVMMAFFTTAKVTVYASASKVDVDTTYAVDPSLHETDTTKNILAGQPVSFSKDLTGTFTATGQQDAGTKATGTITVVNNNAKPFDFVAGTRFLAPDGKVFRSINDAHIDPATATIVGSPPHAVIVPSKKDIGVVADANGDSYNEAPAQYSIPGLSAADQAGTNGSGKQMSGGTSKIITIVSQDDINKAQKAAIDADASNVQKSLDGQAPTGYVTLPSSLAQTSDNIVSNPAVNQQGTAATVTFKQTYTELAVKKSDYTALVNQAEQKQVGAANQIYQDGIGTATVTFTGKNASGASNFHFTTEAFGGAKLDTAQITKAIKSKKYGDAQDYLGKLPGVVQSQVTLWPAWASNLPGQASKITITIQVAGTK